MVKELIENSVDAGATIIGMFCMSWREHCTRLIFLHNQEVRFKNQGLDLIEVQDNGSGISPDNYASVALKHHTSKLSTYSDIESLQTFGFRGEALASLCALSSFTVTTCLAEDVPKGSKLTFETSGKLKSTSIVAAQRGTSVSVEKLFHNLPVRRRELERNIKREWHKVIALLNQYACIQTNLKFSVSQQPTKGKRILLFSTKGNQTTKDNIINIFGAKTMAALVPLDLKLEMKPTVSNAALQGSSADDADTKDVKVLGHVSRPVHGEGRLTPDRQMFFVNGRPCGLPQFSKTFNEVYKSYNYSQSPFIFADIRLDTSMYDVNVSPDKRSILLHDQGSLLDNLRVSLTELFDNHEYTVPVAKLWAAGKPGTSEKPKQQAASDSIMKLDNKADDVLPKPDASNVIESGDEAMSSPEPPDQEETIRTTRTSSRINISNQSLISQWAAKKLELDDDESSEVTLGTRKSPPSSVAPERRYVPRTETQSPGSESDDEMDAGKPLPVRDFNKRLAEKRAIRTKASYLTRDKESSPEAEASPVVYESSIPGSQPLKIQNVTNRSRVATPQSLKRRTGQPVSVTVGSASKSSTVLFGRQTRGSHGLDAENIRTDDASRLEDPMSQSDTDSEVASEAETEAEYTEMKDIYSKDQIDSEEEQESQHDQDIPTDTVPPKVKAQTIPQQGAKQKSSTHHLTHTIQVDEASMVHQLQYFMSQETSHNGDPDQVGRVEDLEASDAESKLQLIIAKEDFGRMRITGQFNLGFIIATRPSKRLDASGQSADGDELFIIDQHASDEKYNFERLQNTTIVQAQRLVQPKRLQLTALEEEVVLENIEAIESNGFKINVDLSGDWPVGARCELTSLPLSRETAFTIEDLEELIALLAENAADSSHIPRPSKVRKMFAMRACRSSVMIGKALNASQMSTLVKHMGELDKPWNCPHGRPTMRHLCRLKAWDDKIWKGDVRQESLSGWQDYCN